jgi:hypothetical protein
MDALAPEHRRFVTISYFVRNMMGYSSRNWYYRHRRDPGFPQVIMLPGHQRALLDFDECKAYQERLVASGGGQWPPVQGATPL